MGKLQLNGENIEVFRKLRLVLTLPRRTPSSSLGLQAGHVFLNQLALCPVQVGMLRSHSFAVALNWLLTLPCAFPRAVSQR